MKRKRSKYPMATLAFYGPTDRIATKAVVGIIPRDGDDVDAIHKWITTLGDIRRDPVIGAEIKGFLKEHDVKSFVTMLSQTERFGTSLSQALRSYADSLRTRRRQIAEEAAAKTTIKMIFPLVLFILPALLVVILGPAFVQIAKIFK